MYFGSLCNCLTIDHQDDESRESSRGAPLKLAMQSLHSFLLLLEQLSRKVASRAAFMRQQMLDREAQEMLREKMASERAEHHQESIRSLLHPKQAPKVGPISLGFPQRRNPPFAYTSSSEAINYGLSRVREVHKVFTTSLKTENWPMMILCSL